MGTKSKLNADIKALLADGRRIEAIKLAMDKLHVGIAEAKRYVDNVT